MSRGVRCGIVSTRVKRSIATDAMIPLIRARARGLSLTSTNCALPESRTARAVAMSASGFAPSGGSSWTETTNLSSSSRRASCVRPLTGADAQPRQPFARGAGGDASERLAVAVEGHQRDDRQARDGADRGDRGLEVGQVEERLDHEQVGAAALEQGRLLRVETCGVGAAEL